MMHIRPASASDVPEILALIRALAVFEKLEHEVVATEDSLRETLFGVKPSAEVVIAEIDDGTAIGFALYFTTYSTFLAKPGLYLEDLFVKPEYRSRGYGEKLLRHLAATAVSRGYGRFEWSVLDWNTRAREFYERLGAKPMVEWTVHRVSGEALMQLASGQRRG